VVVSGSSNLTGAGLTRNHEQVRVERSWMGGDQLTVIDGLQDEYEALWEGLRDYAATVDLPTAVREQLIKTYVPDRPPTPDDYAVAVGHDRRRADVCDPPPVS